MSTHTDTWWQDPANVNDLVWWLIGKHRVLTAQEAQNCHDYPWRYTLEYTDMLADRVVVQARRLFIGA
jgi:hypothetical protein